MTTMRPTRDEVVMTVAMFYAERSTCDRAHVGAVIARDGRIISTGYNGSPAGMQHCVHNGVMQGTCTWSVHAEANAIAYAARYGISTDRCSLFTTLSPCAECAKLIINAGITRLVYKNPYRDSFGVEFLGTAGIEVVCL